MKVEDAQFGDMIAFNTPSLIGNLIKTATFGNVTHVAFVTGSDEIVESTMLDSSDKDGVYKKSLSEKVEACNGDIWHLRPKKIMTHMRKDKCDVYIESILGFPYDKAQAAKSALDIFTNTPEDFNAFFCSELCTKLYKVGGILKDINASEVTPVNLCALKIWDWCRQIQGKNEIRKFNKIPLELFNEY